VKLSSKPNIKLIIYRYIFILNQYLVSNINKQVYQASFLNKTCRSEQKHVVQNKISNNILFSYKLEVISKYKNMRKRYKLMLLLTIISSVSYAQSELNIGTGSFITTTGASALTLHNSKLVNNGTITDANGTLQFIGNQATANTTISGTGTTILNNLTVDKSSNNLQISKNLVVTNNLTLTAGNVILDNATVNLQDTGIVIGETETKAIKGATGNIIVSGNLNTPNQVNLGNLGAIVTSSSNLGQTTVSRTHTPATIDGQSIARVYTITPTNNTGLNATLVFNYFDNELNGNVEANLSVWQSTDGGANWTATTGTLNAVNNTITVVNIDSFGQYTADITNVLSVNNVAVPQTFVLYKNNGALNIKSNQVIAAITIYDLTGKKIIDVNNLKTKEKVIPLNAMATQVLIIKTQFKNGSQITKKVLF